MSDPRMAQIRERLNTQFSPTALEITDQSADHAGHASANGGGHFTVNIVAAAFADCSALVRHRMVYKALDDVMGSEVHALSIQARSPNEA